MLSTINRKKYPLFVLSASAGSGKTYQLVLQYLSILLGAKSPSKYKGIVAITFTNKASLEMKTRIIDALFNLAQYDGVDEDQKTESIIEELEKLLKIEKKQIVYRCGESLKAILHGYENFNVSTIDKFNLRLIKSFSNDLDLPSEFEISLNEKEVLEEVLDLLLNSIGETGNQDLTKLVKEYAKSNFRDGNQWNFKWQLMSFASSLNKEKNQGFIKTLMNISFNKEEYYGIQNQSQKLHAEFSSKVLLYAEAFYALNIKAEELPYKGTTYNALVKIAEMSQCPVYKKDEHLLSKRLLNYCDEPGDTKALTQELKEILLELDHCYLKIVPELALLNKYKANFFNMALLKYILDSLSEHKEKNKIIRISEFNELIGNLVQKEEAPYIYERFGVRYEHFLLDEFQDTSRLQWLNLLPLLRESLGHKRENLIVGDPKQSIYRFNNGLAEQFVSLPKVYNPDNDAYVEEVSSFFNEMGLKKPLKYNYRSCPEIVAFNEKIFTNFSKKLSEKFAEFYESVAQDAVSKKTGYVRVISENKKRDLELMISEITEIIDDVEKNNFDLGDVCILTARNSLGVQIANELTKKGVSVFSQESLLISKNIQVRLLLSYLKWRMRPTMDTMKRQFAELFFRMHESTEDRYFEFLKEKNTSSGYSYKVFDDEQFLNEFFKGRDRFFKPFENIYELAIQFISMMDWKESENPFLHQFVDLIFQFQNNRQSDLSKFIEYYEEHKASFALKMPDSKNAVQIMTIHKAKGLEFPVVIVPEMDFGLSLRGDSKFFVEAQDKILYTSLSQSSIIEEINLKAEEEKNLILLDKLNMLYVAFTRAENRLYVFNRFDRKSNLGAIFHEYLNDTLKIKDDEGCCEYISGSQMDKYEGRVPEIDKQEGSFYTPSDIPVDSSKVELILGDVDRESYHSQEERLFGIYFHQFISEINTVEEIPEVLKKYQENDLVDSALLEGMVKSAYLFFEGAAKSALFESVINVYNEQSILIPKSKFLRPDKIIERKLDVVVIDFKTGAASPSHHEQIWNYKSVLEEIYEKPVKAVLYYTKENRLIEI